MALIVPSLIGISYFFPVRLSVTLSVLLAIERASLSNVATSRSDDGHCFEHDFPPAIFFSAYSFDAHFHTIGDQRNKRLHAELRRLLQDDFEFFELNDGHRQ